MKEEIVGALQAAEKDIVIQNMQTNSMPPIVDFRLKLGCVVADCPLTITTPEVDTVRENVPIFLKRLKIEVKQNFG